MNPLANILHWIPILKRWYKDADGDGYGNPKIFINSIKKPIGYVNNPSDTDDSDPNVYPGSDNNPQTSTLRLQSTGSPVKDSLHGASMENSWFVSGNSSTPFNIESNPFMSNVNSMKFKLLGFPGSQPGHYLKYINNDNNPDGSLTAKGGFNCDLCSNNDTNCCVDYRINGNITSCFPKFIRFAGSLSTTPKVLLQINPNLYDAAGYSFARDYADTNTGGFFGHFLEEFSDNSWQQCALCGNKTAIANQTNTIYNDAVLNYPDAEYTIDWNGLFAGQSYSPPYSNAQAAVGAKTSSRAYISERFLIPASELVSGRTPDEYKVSIDTATEITFVNMLIGVKQFSNVPLAVTAYFSMNSSPFAETYLQLYFLSKYKVSEILREALNPGSIAYSLHGRFDLLNAKETTLNFNGLFLQFLGEMFNNPNSYVFSYQSDYPGTYGVGFDNGTNGTLLLINPLNLNIQETNININGVNRPIISTSWLKSTSLNSSVLSGTSGIPPFSVTLIRF